jgi:hypothetical protein
MIAFCQRAADLLKMSIYFVNAKTGRDRVLHFTCLLGPANEAGSPVQIRPSSCYFF